MPQSLANIAVHIVFSTKNHIPFLRRSEIRSAMHQQLGSVSQNLQCSPITVGGFEDHIHILARQARTITLADWIKEIKRVTSLWIKEQYPTCADFQWQTGYGAFSVSQSNIEEVVAYIRDQEEHHKHFDFKTEYRKLLERHHIQYDERYVWD